MKIKALSLWQPWASLIAVGAKKFETRSWSTSYRGPLAIHASLTRKGIVFLKKIRQEAERLGIKDLVPKIFFLPLGVLVGIADLTDCLMVGASISRHELPPEELICGDFSPGRYAWKLENVRAIKPFPVKGRQGLFEIELPEGLIL